MNLFIEDFYGGEYQSTDEYISDLYQKFIAVIPQELNSDFKASLKSKLKYHNEYSLRKRIKTFICSHKELLPDINESYYSSKVTDTRNFFAHRTLELQENTATGSELYEITQNLNIIIKIILYEIIGFEKTEIEAILKK